MFPKPDVETLTLCSLLASLAFALVFLALWMGRRSERHLLHWMASSASYAGALLAFAVLRHWPSATVVSLLCGVLAGSNVLLVSGARAFHGLAPFRRWMIAPPLIAIVGDMLPRLATPLGISIGPEGHWASQTAGIAIACAIAGIALGRLRSDAGYRGQRIATCAILGYLPTYIAVILGALSTDLIDRNIMVALPLLSDQLLLGVLYLGLLAMPGERSHQILMFAAHHDPLTQALNRAGLEACAERFLNPGACVVAIDVDSFKSINDRNGHAAGDAVLIALASAAIDLAAQMGGVVARIGGDEFLILLQSGGVATGQILERRLRSRLAVERAGTPSFTFSLGMAEAAEGEQTIDRIVHRADIQLYESKAFGRILQAA